jgi:hypothetical protein
VYYVRAPRVMGKIMERDQGHWPSPEVQSGMGNAASNGGSHDHPLWNKAILHLLPVLDPDQRLVLAW